MNCGYGSRLAGIQKLKKIKSLAGTNFAQQDRVRAMPQSRLEQVANRNRRSSICLRRASTRKRFVCTG
jgi:hypothetical protein